MRVAPRATYRVQLRAEFDFAAAAAIAGYLGELGISHLYCSPYMQAAHGSPHGYDVVDPTQVSEELGGEPGLRHLDSALQRQGMGQLLDIVPNHMCISEPRNRWWWDVLARGQASAYAGFFDIDWLAPGLEGRILLPVLRDTIDNVLARQELRVEPTTRGAVLAYFEDRFPLVEGVAVAPGPAERGLLDQQHYILDHWRAGLKRLNYRRFFDVASLVALHAENDAVYAETHHRALELVSAGVVDGLRVDHVDGLNDPDAYTARLASDTAGAWLVVEKILGPGEQIPAEWPVAGSTGYDFAALTTALMVDAPGLQTLDQVYREFTGDQLSFAQHSHRARCEVLDTLLIPDLERLSRVAAAAGIAPARTELAELVAGMPVYRMYPRRWEPLREADASALRRAVSAARDSGRCDPDTLDALAAVLAARGPETAAKRELRVRFQQLSSAAVAKGVEDTAFYRYTRLVALNEVGGEPDPVLPGADDFHAWCAEAAQKRPRSLLATATHDTKRGEDARVRIAMLSEVPAVWTETVRALSHAADPHRGTDAPSRSAEYLLYQTLLGAHPLDADRAVTYMIKAAREAKQQTSWLDPQVAYEQQLEAFVRGVVANPEVRAALERLLSAISPAWVVASLSQTLLKLTCPGVPDIYQGCELWDLNLVDPDNRRPVDYSRRASLLHRLDGVSPKDLMALSDDALPKLHVVRAGLAQRRRHAAAFAPNSTYRPLSVAGECAEHALAFARGGAGGAEVLVIAVRRAHALAGEWGGTTVELPAGAWHNVLSGEATAGGEQRIAAICAGFPVALLEAAA